MFPSTTSSQGPLSNLSKKIAFWQNCTTGKDDVDAYCEHVRKNGRPPNVLLVGIDSMSRSSFYRSMIKSGETLLGKIGAIDFRGYTKVGENTFPNMIPLLTSLSLEELTKLCWQNRSIPLDNCPFIWKNFSDRGYLTAHLEDAPKIAIFNYRKMGFLRPPTDIYLRPFMIAAYTRLPISHGCIGYQRTDEIVLNHVIDLTTLSKSNGVPYFVTAWLSHVTHAGNNKLELMDAVMDKTLRNLHEKGLLENTVLLVMGDHGNRFGTNIISGWYENRLPALFIKIPEKWTKKYPSWLEALHRNANQLTTPFNIHAMLKDIYSISGLNPSSTTVKDRKVVQGHVASTRGVSLLEKIPDRTCEEAGVPMLYCACHSLVEYAVRTPPTRLGAEAVIRRLNEGLPPICERQRLSSIVASSVFVPHLKENGPVMEKFNTTDFIILLKSLPGNFYFEARVTFNHAEGNISHVHGIERRSRIDPSVIKCILPRNYSLENFCYCRP